MARAVTLRRAAASLAALALVVASCSSGDDGTAAESPTPDAATSSTTAPAPDPTAAPTTTETATTAPTTTEAAPAAGLRLVTVNLLHGLELPGSCATGTDQCAAPVRLDLLWDQIESQAACPDVVALQEISPRQQELVPATLDDLCDGIYTLLREDLGLPDQVMILTSLPVEDDAFVDIAGPPWTAHWARLDAGGATIDVFASHFASSALNPPCAGPGESFDSCPEVCPVGIEMGSCNAIESVAFLDEVSAGAPAALQLLVGDLNRPLDDPRIAVITDAGFVDTWLEAGNPECDPATGEGCTCCVGGDGPYDGLEERDHLMTERIDFVFVRPGEGCAIEIDPASDEDGDGTGTGLFPTGPLDSPVQGLYWSADHHGVQADIAISCS